MQISNIEQLRNDLLKKYEEAKTEELKKDLNQCTQTASAIIRSVKVELDYNKHKGKTGVIKFLEV